MWAAAKAGDWRLLADRRLIIFAICAALFHLANAAMLPSAAKRCRRGDAKRGQRGGPQIISTTMAGLVADHLGDSAAFLSLAGVGLIATGLMWTVMPETRAAEEAESALEPLANHGFSKP